MIYLLKILVLWSYIYYNNRKEKIMKKETAQERYNKKAIIRIEVKLNKFTNMNLLEKINTVKNRQGYIKELIKNDENIFKLF